MSGRNPYGQRLLLGMRQERIKGAEVSTLDRLSQLPPYSAHRTVRPQA
jgi:hypothetical protein